MATRSKPFLGCPIRLALVLDGMSLLIGYGGALIYCLAWVPNEDLGFWGQVEPERSEFPSTYAGTYSLRAALVGNELKIDESGHYRLRHGSCRRSFIEIGTIEQIDTETWSTEPAISWSRRGLGSDPHPMSFTFVTWGTRTYLLDSERLDLFVNAIHVGMEPSLGIGHSNFYIKQQTSDIVLGQPSMPLEFKAQIGFDPITETITVLSDVNTKRVGGELHYCGTLELTNHESQARRGFVFVIFSSDGHMIGQATVTHIDRRTLTASFLSIDVIPCEGIELISWSTQPHQFPNQGQ